MNFELFFIISLLKGCTEGQHPIGVVNFQICKHLIYEIVKYADSPCYGVKYCRM